MSKRVIREQHGFTLVELLIVVIILAILAAIVVPQFSSPTEEARVSSLDATLGNVRAAIDLYYQQHGHYPSAVAASGGTCTGGTAGAGAADTEAAFLDQLAFYTNAAGQACSLKLSGAFPYGPYLKKRSLSANPLTQSSKLVIVKDGNLVMSGNSSTAGGWKLDNVTGRFIADDHVNKDIGGSFYDTH